MEGIMSNNTNTQDLKGKTKIACKKLNKINKEKESISEKLEKISNKLIEIINEKKIKEDRKQKIVKKDRTQEEEKLNIVIDRNRTEVKGTPERIWILVNGVNIYIDFTIIIEEGNIEDDVFGTIVYGTSIFNEKEKVEDKPLLKFTFGSNGIISSGDEFENKYWDNDKEGIQNMYYRAIEFILKDVYYWTNKYILP